MELENEVRNTMTLDELEEIIFEMIPDLKEAAIKPAVMNPFKSSVKLTSSDILQICILCFLVPIRLLFVGIAIFFAGMISKLLLFHCGRSNRTEPLSGIRRHGNTIVWFFARCCLFAAGIYRVNLKGKFAESMQEAPVVVAAPHSTYLDGLMIGALQKTFSIVSRVENLHAPILGNCVQMLDPILVARNQKSSRMDVVKEITKRAKDKRYHRTMIFPEGTCTNREAIITFKPGAFYPGVPVQPVLIRYFHDKNYSTWTWDGHSAWKSLFLLTSRLYTSAELEILPVYVPSEEEKADAFLYSKNVRDYMAKAMSIPVTDHSFEDCRLMLRAKKLGLPMEAGLVEYYKLSPLIGMNVECMVEYLQKFAAIDTSCDGVLDIYEFRHYLNLPDIKEVQNIFRIYDISNDQCISFREYLLGFFLISRPFNTEENIRMAFQMFSSEGSDDYINLDGFRAAIKTVLEVDDEYVEKIFKEMDKNNREKADYDEFKEFCLNKPEYALLFIHFRKLRQEKSSMTFSRSKLQRHPSISEFQKFNNPEEKLSTRSSLLTKVSC